MWQNTNIQLIPVPKYPQKCLSDNPNYIANKETNAQMIFFNTTDAFSNIMKYKK